MIFGEVNSMDEQNVYEVPENEQPEGYTPRPAWQVWTARIGVLVMILLVIYQLLQIAGVTF